MDVFVVIIWLTVGLLGVIFLILVDYDALLLSNWDNFFQMVCLNPPFLTFWPSLQLPCYLFTVFKFQSCKIELRHTKKQKRVDTDGIECRDFCGVWVGCQLLNFHLIPCIWKLWHYKVARIHGRPERWSIDISAPLLPSTKYWWSTSMPGAIW